MIGSKRFTITEYKDFKKMYKDLELLNLDDFSYFSIDSDYETSVITIYFDKNENKIK